MEIKFKDYIAHYVPNQVIKRGIELHHQNAVKELDITINCNWVTIKANVKGSQGDDYSVELEIMVNIDGEIHLDYFCSCPYTNNYLGCCKHIVAVLIAASSRLSFNSKANRVMDSQNILGDNISAPAFDTSSSLLDNLHQEVFKSDISDIALGTNTIKLDPEFEVASDYYRSDSCVVLKCRIKAGKSYLIKDLFRMVYYFNTKSYYQYGKFLAFTHDINYLDEQSKKLFWIISRHYSGPIKSNDRRWMEMDFYDFDEVFGMYMNNYVKFCGKKTYVVEDDPPIKIYIDGVNIIDWIQENYDSDFIDREKLENKLKEKKSIDDLVGAYITGQKLSVLMEGKHYWVYQNGIIYKCSEKFSSQALPALKSIGLAERCWAHYGWEMSDYCAASNKNSKSNKNSILRQRLNTNDFTKFCHLILPVLEDWDLIGNCDVDFSGYKPVEPTFKFYLSYEESTDSYHIEPKVKYSKDELIFFYKTSELRDMNKESEVMNVIERYFDVLGMGYLEYAEKLLRYPDKMSCHTRDDIFRLFSTGLNELSLYGDIYTSKNWKDVSIVKTPQINIDMSVNDGLIDLSVSSAKLTDAEIVEIIQQYKLDKKYFVNDNGDYVYVDDSQIKSLADIADTLNLDYDSLNDAEIPLFRALYLDEKISKNNSGLRTKRDKAFKELISRIKGFKNLDIDIPVSVDADFRTYQKEGFRWLTTLCQFNLGAILADDMGLGKTLQAISVIVNMLNQNKASKSALKTAQKCLIVCPASLVYNWKDEFDKFAPTVNVSLVLGSASDRQNAISADADVYVTSYNSLARDILQYKNTKFSICILDEAQYIKNSTTKLAKATKKINSINRFVLTGTPIENNLGDLWSIFDFIMPGYLYTKKQFTSSFTKKIKNGDKDALSELQKLVSPFILRRLKQDVLTELPDKIENIQTIDLLPDQRKLYDAHVEILRRDILTTEKQEFKTKAIKYLSMLMKLRQICCSPELLQSDSKDSDNLPDCSSGKVDATIEAIIDCVVSGHKVLVFSQFTSMLEILQREFSKLMPEASFLYLSGKNTKEQRRRMVQKFQSGKIDVFFISLKAGGIGLNLTCADRVIHVDPWWNFAAEQQASDRTHRIGQKNSVYVTKLVAKNTIEEKIIHMQQQKKKLSEAIVGIEESSSPKFNKKELLQLLE